MVLRHAHELRGSFHWDAEAHRIHGNSSDTAMMIVVGTLTACVLVVGRNSHRDFCVRIDQARGLAYVTDYSCMTITSD